MPLGGVDIQQTQGEIVGMPVCIAHVGIRESIGLAEEENAARGEGGRGDGLLQGKVAGCSSAKLAGLMSRTPEQT